MVTISETPVLVLCGGFGTRLKEETGILPKPMVPIGKHPILWHIMRTYAHFGFKKFILCLGYRSEIIKDYFLNYSALNSDFTVNLACDEMTVHSVEHSEDWEVTLAFTGDNAMTGCRVARAAYRYLGDAENFAVTYGDGLTNADLADEFQFHLSHGKIGTVLGVNPPSRFGELKLNDENQVLQFEEKPEFAENWINGGYFFFKRDFVHYVEKDNESCILERSPLIRLTNDGELYLYKHSKFWACMDTQRDMDQLNKLWASDEVPWKR